MIELSVVVPTFNERENIRPLLQSLASALSGIAYEVIFVDDDSTDGTANLAREISLAQPNVRVVHRVNRRGLASACIEGMMSSAAPYVAVMDGDLQHDERILPQMLEKLKTEGLDIVVGSRNVEGGSMGEFSRRRVALSMLGRRFSQYVCGCNIQDPMSGFFLLRRTYLMEVIHRVSAIGFKILVDLLASTERPIRFGEVPYRFRNRERGESKLDILVGVEYLQLVLDKLVGAFIPASFVLFALVGTAGVGIHMFVLWLALFGLGMQFGPAQIIAALAAMTMNFLFNNTITYRDRRLRGWQILRGLVTFFAACLVGLWINLQIANALRTANLPWYAAGFFGLVIGSVWNYGITRFFTWRSGQTHARRRMARQAEISQGANTRTA